MESATVSTSIALSEGSATFIPAFLAIIIPAYTSYAHLEDALLPHAHLEGANLQGAYLDAAILSEAHLEGAHLLEATLTRTHLYKAHLEEANISNAILDNVILFGAHLERAYLSVAHLERVDLDSAHLEGAFLDYAHLEGVKLREASLREVHLYGAHLEGSDLRKAHLEGADFRACRMDVNTVLSGAKIDARTRLVDAVWNGAPITRLNWDEVAILGDEYAARQEIDTSDSAVFNAATVLMPYQKRLAYRQSHTAEQRKSRATRLREYQDAELASRQVASLLRGQGLNQPADRFAYRAQFLQRQVLLRQRRYLSAFGSRFLDLISGYGYKPMRSFLTYILVILGFAAAYFALGGANGKPLSWNEAIVVSMTAFHGRGFFSAVFQPGDLQAAIAAVEAFIGLLIEIVFIATFTQRFFAR